MLSDRLPHVRERNRLALQLEARRVARQPIVDLTVSNPTQVGLAYPPDLLAGLASIAGLRYMPEAFGLDSARMAVASDCRRRGAEVDWRQIVLTASTSEAYS